MSVVEVLGGKRKQGRGPYWSAPFSSAGKTVIRRGGFPNEDSLLNQTHALGGSSDGMSGMPGNSGSRRIGSTSGSANATGSSVASSSAAKAVPSTAASPRAENTSTGSILEKSAGSRSARSPKVVTGGG